MPYKDIRNHLSPKIALPYIFLVLISSIGTYYYVAGQKSNSETKILDVRIFPRDVKLQVGSKETFQVGIFNGSKPFEIDWYVNGSFYAKGEKIEYGFEKPTKYVILSVNVRDALRNFGADSTFVYDPISFPTVIEAGSMISEASYIIFKDGSTYYARNGTTGAIQFSGTNKTTVILSALSKTPPSGVVVLKQLSLPLSINVTGDRIVEQRLNGQTIRYPFPYMFSDLLTYSTIYTGSVTFRLGYLDLLYNKNLWAKSGTGTLGWADCRFGIQSNKPLWGFGTYQFRYRISGWETGKDFVVGLFIGGQCSYGDVHFEKTDTGVTQVGNSWNGVYTLTTITGWDPTVESVLKFEWTATQIKFYVNDVLKATHTTNIPQGPLPFGWEITHVARTADYTSDSRAYFRDFHTDFSD